MIWFSCRQCGTVHGREESLVGTLVFCACGQGNRVPYESNVAEPPPAPPPVNVVIVTPPSIEVPAENFRAARWRRGQARRQVDSSRCLNHVTEPSTAKCLDCGEGFCSACTVTLGAATLCGPCKDFRVRRALRPRRTSTLATIAFLLSILIAGPFGFGVPLSALAFDVDGSSDIAWVGTLCGLGGLVLLLALCISLLALRQTERQANLGGRSLALAATASAALGLLWDAMLFAIAVAKG